VVGLDPHRYAVIRRRAPPPRGFASPTAGDIDSCGRAFGTFAANDVSQPRRQQMQTITDLELITGGNGTTLERVVDGNAKDTARRFQLVQSGALDREDFQFFLDNQRRAAKVIADR
jgi:hypothetical protein